MGGVTPSGIRYPDGASKAKNLGPELKTMAEDIDTYIGSYLKPTGPIRQIVIGITQEIVPPMIPPLVEEYLEENNVARRTDPGYPQVTTNPDVFYEVVDPRLQLSFLQVRMPDGAPSHASGRLIAKTLQELGYTLSGGNSGGGDRGGAPASPYVLNGDSTMADEPFKTGLEEEFGFPFYDLALSGQTMWERAFDFGVLGSRVSVSVEGGTIPASGSVTVTTISSGTWNTAVGEQRETPCSIAGVRGVLIHPDSTHPGWSFRRLRDGDAVPCPAGTPVVVLPGPKTGIGFERLPQLLMAGRNVPDDFANFVVATSALIEQTNVRVLMPPWKIAGEARGTAGFNRIEAMAEWDRETHPELFFDLPAWLAEEGLAAAGIAGTGADDTAISEGRIPPSLTADGLHLKPAVSTILREPLAFVIREKGL